MTVPSYEDLVGGKVTVSQLRRVELDDLLGRDPVELDAAGLHDWLTGRTVLVTGAGGSIGAELCRQILRFAPAQLVVLEQHELALYTIEQEFGDRERPRRGSRTSIGDVKHEAARRRGDRGAPAVGDLPRRRVQARAADGGGQRLGGGAQQRARHLAGRRGRGSPARRGEVRARLDRQGGQPDQRDGRLQAAGRDALPAAAPTSGPGSCRCASATCSAPPAASSRSSASRSPRRAGDGDASRDHGATSCRSPRRRSSCCRRG